jgi:hypothetical protein
MQNTHPSLLPRTPRACRARPLNYHGNRRDDRSTRREIARHVARRVTRVSIARKKTLASVQTTPPPPPTLDPRLRRDPTERHHYTITKRSARFAERTV